MFPTRPSPRPIAFASISDRTIALFRRNTRNDSRSTYDVLFEPVRIGPVEAPNRFYQVPHCNGMGFLNCCSRLRGTSLRPGAGN